ncbi:9ce0a055-f545-49ad-b2f3-753f7dead186 [Thermothielavioides terrestris]|nr:9ce0a055-f545-49ad-b2f3-753f7dead186 [Thermothielavioides terrestris]
MVVAIIL